MRVLFFLENLRSGGKERRAVELFHYLKRNTQIDFQIVVTEKEIHYDYISKLGIPIIVLKRGLINKDPLIFFKFFKVVKKFKPDIIHSWGAMSSFYAILSAKYFQIPLLNGQVSDAIPKKYRSTFGNILVNINFYFSTLLFSNSRAGLEAYMVNSKKGVVIHNGIRLERFEGLASKKEIITFFNITTPLCVIMVGRFNDRKDFELFLLLAKSICKMRNDTTFIAIGEGQDEARLKEKVKKMNLNQFIFTGRISNVEDLVNTCDIGVLLTNTNKHAEGIPNAVMEYMALSKPVIATDVGGTKELVKDNVSGYLVENDLDFIVNKINVLLNNPKLRRQMGREGRKIIENCFTIDQMGKAFVNQYNLFLK